MRIAALIFGIIGALAGLGISACVWTGAGLVAAMGGGEEIGLRGFLAFINVGGY